MKAHQMNTSHYLLHPRAPLVLGTGKPLDFGLGGDSLTFPFPNTVAGALRAAHSAQQGGVPDPYADIRGLALHQMALARFNWLQPEVPPTLLLPRPVDAVYLNQKMLHLTPQPVPSDSWTDLPAGLQVLTLQGNDEDKKGKPDPAPAWWSTADYSQWLAKPAAMVKHPIQNNLDTLPDERTHVVIDPRGKGAVSGGLFRSTGRDFGPHRTPTDRPPPRQDASHGYALAISTQEPQSLHGSTRRLGGEGRFVRFEQCKPDRLWTAVTPPPGLDKATRIRFILTTPAVFPEKGWHPDTLAYNPTTNTIGGTLNITGRSIAVQLLAAAINRAQSYSGWQQNSDSRPGPGRPWRVVPAGSVYWLQVQAGDAPALWEQSLCTNTHTDAWQDNGWGRGLVGLA